MKPITLEWVAKAEGDWDSAQREYRARRRPNYDAACFHAQQCAEKYLKARLEEAAIAFGRTHNLISLLTLVLAVLRAEGFDYTHRTLAGTYTCNANARATMLDYVFYTEALKAQPMAVPVIDDQTPLPSYDQPSDHLALTAHFNWH